MRTVRIPAGAVTAEAFAPFGWLPVADTDPADGAHTLTYEWGDPHCNVIAHAYDEVDHTDTGAQCTRLYRHDTHTQVLMPINVEAIVAVARGRAGRRPVLFLYLSFVGLAVKSMSAGRRPPRSPRRSSPSAPGCGCRGGTSGCSCAAPSSVWSTSSYP